MLLVRTTQTQSRPASATSRTSALSLRSPRTFSRFPRQVISYLVRSVGGLDSIEMDRRLPSLRHWATSLSRRLPLPPRPRLFSTRGFATKVRSRPDNRRNWQTLSLPRLRSHYQTPRFSTRFSSRVSPMLSVSLECCSPIFAFTNDVSGILSQKQ